MTVTHQQSYLDTDDSLVHELAMRYQPGGYVAEVRMYTVEQVADDITIIASVPVCAQVAERPAQRFNYLAWRQFITSNRDRFLAGEFNLPLDTEWVTQQAGS